MAPNIPLSTVDSDAVRVLVAEDDEGLGQVLARGLREQGYVVDLVPDGETAAAYLRFYQYEVAVLDWRMPRLSGFDLVQRMRRGGATTPVLMLTARDTPADRIAGLDAGAYDYLVKPFDFGELLARLRALLRRVPEERPVRLQAGDLVVDPATRRVTRAGAAIELTAREFAVLEYLARHAGEVVTRSALLDHVWDANFEGSTNVVDQYVGALRRKLGAPLIHTVRGTGFRLAS